MLQLPEHRRGDPYWEKRRADYLANRGQEITFATEAERTAFLRLIKAEEKLTGEPALILIDDGMGDGETVPDGDAPSSNTSTGVH